MDDCYTGGYCSSTPAAFDGNTCFSAGSKCSYTEDATCPSSGFGFGCGGAQTQTRSCVCTATGVGLTKWKCTIDDSGCGSGDGGYDGPWWDSSGYDSGNKDAQTSESDIVIGSLQGSPHGVAVISGNVFVIDDDRLVLFTVAPIGDGGWTGVPIAMDLGGAYGLTASSDWLYWSSVSPEAGSTSIMRLRVQPQIGVPEIVAPTSMPPLEGIAADSTGVRWLEPTIGLVESDGDGGSNVLASAPILPTGVFSTIARVNGATHFVAPDQLLTLADDGGQSATSVPRALAVAADPLGVYTARATDGGVSIDAIVDGGLSQIGGSTGMRAMVHGGDALYIVDDLKHWVRAVGLGNTPSVLLASTKAAPHDLAVDSKYVYYTLLPAQPASGEVHRVPR